MYTWNRTLLYITGTKRAFLGAAKVPDIADKSFLGTADILSGAARVMPYQGCLLPFYLCLNVDIRFFILEKLQVEFFCNKAMIPQSFINRESYRDYLHL